jgi:membrane-associated protease RseP (regulator of RpoE activity)
VVIGVLLQEVEFEQGEFGTLEGGLRIVGLQEGYPAKREGLAVGDVIVGLDDEAVNSTPDFVDRLNNAPAGPRTIHAARSTEVFAFEATPTIALDRSTLDHQRCLDVGNPPDFWLGAVAAPSYEGDRYVVPLYPGTSGRLFEPREASLRYRTEPLGVSVMYGKDLRDDIVRFDYIDRDRALVAETESGERYDLGMRLECQVQPGLVSATEITLRRVLDDEEVDVRVVPLRQVN